MKNSVPAFASGQSAQGMGASAARPRIEFARLRDLALVPALALLIVIGAFVSPSFLTKANLISVLGASAALAPALSTRQASSRRGCKHTW